MSIGLDIFRTKFDDVNMLFVAFLFDLLFNNKYDLNMNLHYAFDLSFDHEYKYNIIMHSWPVKVVFAVSAGKIFHVQKPKT